VTLHQSNFQRDHAKLPCGSVTIPAESHKTRLLERKMEIGFFLGGVQGYLDNAGSVLAIFDDW
jgi:hypothetical protein